MDNDTTVAMQDLAVRWTKAHTTVAGFVRSLVRDHHDAEDILQRTAAALVTNHGKYDPAQPFVGWAIGVARVEVLRYRQERRRCRIVFDDATIAHIADAYQRHGPELSEVQSALDRCIDALQGRVRQIFERHHAGGLTPADIGGELRMTPNAVSVALHRGRAAVRRCLERQIGPIEGLA